MQNTENKVVLFIVMLSLLVAGCKTRKSVVETAPLDMESIALVSSSPSVVSPRTCLSGNMKLSVNVDGKPFSAKGTMKIKEGDGVQIGVTALGLVEIACLEFFPANARLIYKLGKEYAEIPYSDVAFLQRSGIDYRMLESVLMNRVFSPDGRPLAEAITDMSFVDEGNIVVATTDNVNGIVYRFHIDKATCNLVQSEGKQIGGGKVVCKYSDFSMVDGSPFPHTISLSLEGVGTDVSLQFVLSRLDSGDFRFTPRSISSSYDRMDVEKMIKSIGNM